MEGSRKGVPARLACTEDAEEHGGRDERSERKIQTTRESAQSGRDTHAFNFSRWQAGERKVTGDFGMLCMRGSSQGNPRGSVGYVRCGELVFRPGHPELSAAAKVEWNFFARFACAPILHSRAGRLELSEQTFLSKTFLLTPSRCFETSKSHVRNENARSCFVREIRIVEDASRVEFTERQVGSGRKCMELRANRIWLAQ